MDRDQIVDRAKEFCENLYSTNRAINESTVETTDEVMEVPKIKSLEVKHAVKTSKKGKAPGPDDVTIVGQIYLS